jgi:hypothetical protein
MLNHSHYISADAVLSYDSEKDPSAINKRSTDWQKTLDRFPTIPLDFAASIDLSARFDSKFLIPLSLLAAELEHINDALILQLNKQGSPISHYSTRYWDSGSYDFFVHHATDRPHRLKVRKRLYEDTGECFLEIKRKRYGKTVKSRIASLFTESFSENDISFLRKQGIDASPLHAVLDVHYKRITFWDKRKEGRITVDLDYEVASGSRHATFPGVAIIEIKGTHKFILQTAKLFHVPLHRYRTGFSKYGIGIVSTRSLGSAEAKEMYSIYKKLVKINAII